MVSDVVALIFAFYIIFVTGFIIKSLKDKKNETIHKLYYAMSLILVIWDLMLILIKFTDPANITLLRIFDAIMYLGPFTPVIALLIVLVFVNSGHKLPKRYYCLLIVPAISFLVVCTDPLHHLFYQKFSLDINEVQFGPYLYISSIYSVVCMVVSIIIMIRFAFHNRSRLCLKQALLFSVGNAIPLTVNVIVSLRIVNWGVVATPLSFIATIILHGYAIYKLHFFDIRPIAMQRVLDWISDGYLVVSENGLVINCNLPFREMFGKQFGISENVYLQDSVEDSDLESKTGLYNLITSIESCRKTRSSISYEQAIITGSGESLKKLYYMVDITPLIIESRIEGFVAIFKDVTKVKESMQRLQDSQNRMMEQERLASLGQMVGGLAHNLKTPIMSISGSVSAMENLITECKTSVGDPDVTDDDYKEIYAEMDTWIGRLREACAYMSDIITAVKGQAKNMSTSEETEFSLEELFKRVSLLLRHEFLRSGCKMEIENHIPQDIYLTGDINNLVQVMNNLVNNAIDAECTAERKEIIIEIQKDHKFLQLAVKDFGTGVSPKVKDRLFKQMITSKGTAGTGLGVFISNAVIRGKFGGEMWMTDNPEGGAVFWISIPLERVTFKDQLVQREYIDEKE